MAVNTIELRRSRLLQLIDELGLSAVSLRARKPASQILDMVKGRKSFGEKVARAIEQNMQLPGGWLDQRDNHATDDASPFRIAEVRSITPAFVLDQLRGILSPLGVRLDDLVDMPDFARRLDAALHEAPAAPHRNRPAESH